MARLGDEVASSAPGAAGTGTVEPAVGPDGAFVYLAGGGGLTTPSADDLRAVGGAVASPALAGIAATPDGLWLLGIDRSGTGIARFFLSEGGPEPPTPIDLTARVAATGPVRLLGIAAGDDRVAQAPG
jgi:hypothetical protein